jgi:hypothetical protein
MIAFLGQEHNKITNILIHLTYEYVCKNPQEYIIFITNKQENLDGLLFENESIDQDLLNNIYIKYIQNYDDLISFLYGLSIISENNLPTKVIIDHLDAILNIVH